MNKRSLADILKDGAAAYSSRQDRKQTIWEFVADYVQCEMDAQGRPHSKLGDARMKLTRDVITPIGMLRAGSQVLRCGPSKAGFVPCQYFEQGDIFYIPLNAIIEDKEAV